MNVQKTTTQESIYKINLGLLKSNLDFKGNFFIDFKLLS